MRDPPKTRLSWQKLDFARHFLLSAKVSPTYSPVPEGSQGRAGREAGRRAGRSGRSTGIGAGRAGRYGKGAGKVRRRVRREAGRYGRRSGRFGRTGRGAGRDGRLSWKG